MSAVGQIEKKTQQRVVKLFHEQLGYTYLGDWADRIGNSNIERDLLQASLKKRGYDDNLIGRALHLFEKAAGDTSKSLYDRNKEVYGLLRYGVKVKPDVGENTQTVWLIDWENRQQNDFGVAEEVSVAKANAKANDKRPDIVLYVNGIALGVLELKRSTVSVAEGIRQNLDNQKKEFIEPFFSTMQFLMAGNDTEGLRYGTIDTREKYFLSWKEENPQYVLGQPTDRKYLSNSECEAGASLLDCALARLCHKSRFLELIHDDVVFDAGTKKLCRHNQFFGVRAAQNFVRRLEGGIIWHTQGSGKSLTMVWFAKWIRENVTDSRVLIVTDRTELDQQVSTVFGGVGEMIYRTSSGADLIATLNARKPRAARIMSSTAWSPMRWARSTTIFTCTSAVALIRTDAACWRTSFSTSASPRFSSSLRQAAAVDAVRRPCSRSKTSYPGPSMTLNLPPCRPFGMSPCLLADEFARRYTWRL